MQLPVALHATDLARGKRVMVIDDDVLVLDGMRGSCRAGGAVFRLQRRAQPPLPALRTVADNRI